MDEIVLSKLEAEVYLTVACEAENIGGDEYRWQGNLLDIAQTAIPNSRIAKKCLHSLIFRKKVIRPLVESKLAGTFLDTEGKVETSRNHLYRIHLVNYTIRGEVKPLEKKKRRMKSKEDFDPSKLKKITDEEKEGVYRILCELPVDSDGWIIGGVYNHLKEKEIGEHTTRSATYKLVQEGRLELRGKDKWRVIKTTTPQSSGDLSDEQLLDLVEKRIAELELVHNGLQGALTAREKAKQLLS